jgi:hypothetical protein
MEQWSIVVYHTQMYVVQVLDWFLYGIKTSQTVICIMSYLK